MSGRSSIIRVSVFGDVNELTDAFKRSQTKAEGWATGMQNAGKKLTMGLTAPIVAGAALAVKAAGEEEQEMLGLANVIKSQIPGATQEAIDANEAWITSIQNTTGVADSELRGMVQKFVAGGASIEDAQKMAATAIDTAAATGKDYNAISDAMVKGMNGQTAGFSRLGINVKNADGSMKSMDEIMVELSQHQGLAAAKMDSTAGRAEIMKLKMADLSEKIGTVLLPIVEKLTGWLSKIVDWFNNLSPAGTKIVVVILAVAAAVGPLLIVGAKLVKAFGTIMKAFKILSAVMSANPWLLLIAAVVALVILIVTNWDTIIGALKKAWKWITDAAGAVGKWLKDKFKEAVDFLVNLFLNFTLPGLIMKHWDKIKEGIGKLVGWVKEKWNGLISWFRELPGRIGNAIGGLWDSFKNTFKSAINWIIGKWNAFKIQIKLPGILGGGTISIDTPNIPKFHTGGMFRAPTPGGEGLAILKDREMVTPAGRSSRGETHHHWNITAGMGADPHAMARVIVESLQRFEASNGPIPVRVRG